MGLSSPEGASEPDELQRALRGAEQALGPIGLIVNAVSAVRPPSDGGGFGGGPIADASDAAFQGWVS